MYTKILISVIIILIIIIYVNYYTNYKKDYNILQTYLDNIDLALIYEKYPIVVYDRVINPPELTKTLFAYSYIYKKQYALKGPFNPVINTSKHAILWSPDSDLTVNIINPKFKQHFKWVKKMSSQPLKDIQDNTVQYVTIKLKKNQIIILHAFWIFDSSNTINIIQMDDLLSFFST